MTAPLPVTARQLELLRAFRRLAERQGRSPTLRELSAELQRSPSTVHQQLVALEERGILKRGGRAAGLTLSIDADQLGPAEPPPTKEVLLRGVLSPGRALRPLPKPWTRIAVGGDVRSSDHALRIEGDRLVGDGILDGDILIVRPGASMGEDPVVLQHADGTWDIKRVITGRDGSVLVAPARPGAINRRSARRVAGIAVKGRVIRLIRLFVQPG